MSRPLFVGIATAAVGGIIAILFQHFVLSSDGAMALQSKPDIEVYELQLHYLDRAGLYVRSETDGAEKKLYQMVAYRIYSSDIERPTTVDAIPFGRGFVEARYSYNNLDEAGVFRDATVLDVYPNEYLTVISFWEAHNSQFPGPKISFVSEDANVEVTNISCTFHPALSDKLCR